MFFYYRLKLIQIQESFIIFIVFIEQLLNNIRKFFIQLIRIQIHFKNNWVYLEFLGSGLHLILWGRKRFPLYYLHRGGALIFIDQTQRRWFLLGSRKTCSGVPKRNIFFGFRRFVGRLLFIFDVFWWGATTHFAVFDLIKLCQYKINGS